MKTLMAIGAHPDDIEIGCGGTISKYLKSGYRLVFVVATNGEEGFREKQKEKNIELRQKEARASAKILGASEILFLNLPDGLTEFSKENKIQLIEVIRRFRPEIVFTHSSFDQFPDHKVIHSLSMSALLGAKGPWYPEAPGEPHEAQAIYGYEVWNPINQAQMTLDISEEMERKVQALSAHESQTSGVDYLNVIKGLAAYRGGMLGGCRFAEAFEVLMQRQSIL